MFYERAAVGSFYRFVAAIRFSEKRLLNACYYVTGPLFRRWELSEKHVN